MLFGFFIRDHGHTELRARYFWDWVCQNTNVHLSNDSLSRLPLGLLVGVIWLCHPLSGHTGLACLVRSAPAVTRGFCRLCPPKISMRVPNWAHEAACRMRTPVRDGTRPELPCPGAHPTVCCMPRPPTNQPHAPPSNLLTFAPIPAALFYFFLRLFFFPLPSLFYQSSTTAAQLPPYLPTSETNRNETMASRILSHGARALTRAAPVRSFTTSPARLDAVVAAPLPARRPVGALRGGYVFPFLSSFFRFLVAR
jgi:hypothetical protein